MVWNRIYWHHVADNWFALDEKIRFLMIALANSLFRYVVFISLIFLFSARVYQLSLFFSWMLSSFTAFAALKYLVFETEGNHLKEYLRSVATLAAGYVLNAVLLWLFVAVLSLNVILAQALALGLITINNYILFRHFAFKDQKIFCWKKFMAIFK